VGGSGDRKASKILWSGNEVSSRSVSARYSLIDWNFLPEEFFFFSWVIHLCKGICLASPIQRTWVIHLCMTNTKEFLLFGFWRECLPGCAASPWSDNLISINDFIETDRNHAKQHDVFSLCRKTWTFAGIASLASTPLGIKMERRFVPENARAPIVVTDDGKSNETDESDRQP